MAGRNFLTIGCVCIRKVSLNTFWHIKAYFTHPWSSMGYKSTCFLFKTTQWNNGKVNPKRKIKNRYKTIEPMRITKTVWKADFLLARMFYRRKKYTRHLLIIVYSFMFLLESKYPGYFLLNIWDMKFLSRYCFLKTRQVIWLHGNFLLLFKAAFLKCVYLEISSIVISRFWMETDQDFEKCLCKILLYICQG